MEADVLDGRGRLPGHESEVEARREVDRRLRRLPREPRPADAARRPASRSSSIAPTAPARPSPRDSSPGSASRSRRSTRRPTAGTSTPAAAPSIPRGWPRASARRGRRSASPTTGTPTGPCGWTGTAACSAATTPLFVQALHMKETGRLRTRRGRGHDHEQHGPRTGSRGERHRARPDQGRRQVRPRGDGRPRGQPGRRAVGPHDLPRRLPDRGRPPDLPADARGHGGPGRDAGRARRRA